MNITVKALIIANIINMIVISLADIIQNNLLLCFFMGLYSVPFYYMILKSLEW